MMTVTYAPPPTPIILRESYFLLSEGPQKVGKSAKVLWNLIRYGGKNLGGDPVFLEYASSESGMLTSVEAVERYRVRLNQ